MNRLAFAVLVLVGCTPDVDQYPVVPTTNGPILAQAHQPPSPTSPDAGTAPSDGATLGDGGAVGGFDALPTAFDAGAPTDVGSPAADAGVPP